MDYDIGYNPNTYIPKDLYLCTHVWILKPNRGNSLSSLYIGPYKVVERDFDNNLITILHVT